MPCKLDICMPYPWRSRGLTGCLQSPTRFPSSRRRFGIAYLQTQVWKGWLVTFGWRFATGKSKSHGGRHLHWWQGVGGWCARLKGAPSFKKSVGSPAALPPPTWALLCAEVWGKGGPRKEKPWEKGGRLETTPGSVERLGWHCGCRSIWPQAHLHLHPKNLPAMTLLPARTQIDFACTQQKEVAAFRGNSFQT